MWKFIHVTNTDHITKLNQGLHFASQSDTSSVLSQGRRSAEICEAKINFQELVWFFMQQTGIFIG